MPAQDERPLHAQCIGFSRNIKFDLGNGAGMFHERADAVRGAGQHDLVLGDLRHRNGLALAQPGLRGADDPQRLLDQPGALVIQADMWRLAQTPVNGRLKFVLCDLPGAHAIAARQAVYAARIRESMRQAIASKAP